MVLFSQNPSAPLELIDQFKQCHLDLFEEGKHIATNNNQIVKSFLLEGKPYIIKRYLDRTPREKLRSAFAYSRAMNSFQKAQKLAAIGINTPSHLFLARHLSLVKGQSFLIMKKSEGTRLHTIINETPDSLSGSKILDELVKLIKRLHSAGFSHGDLHAGNLFVLSDQSLEIIDLDNLHQNSKRQAKDCSRILRSFRKYPSLRAELSEKLSTS